MNSVGEVGPGLMIGDAAPRFSARSTQGPITLDAFRGKWVVLFSHPADFTPVCTSEFIEIAHAADEFAQRDCALLGLSIDSIYSHLAWLGAIRDIANVEIGFPILEDSDMTVARAYGMIDNQSENAGTVRSTFFIDPDGIIRAITCYPATVGRSIPEMLRLLDGLQRTHSGEVLTPANWQPGDDVLATPAQTADAVVQGKGSSWFYRALPDRKKSKRGAA